MLLSWTLHSNMFLLIPGAMDASFGSGLPLHSNMFLLILICYLTAMCIQLSLHSNMFLLILKAQMMWCEIEHLFTFQYVSINTQPTRQNRLANYTLHSNMFLLIQNGCRPFQIVEKSLHSNMFLLIRKSR